MILEDIARGELYLCEDREGAAADSFCIDWCFVRCGNLRIDTHRDNLPMQRFLKKKGFLPCGIIWLEGSREDRERLAFQKKGKDAF